MVIRERLDRRVVNDQWLAFFPFARLENMVAPVSDHSPIMLYCDSKRSECIHKTIKIENVWLLNPELETEVRRG